MIRHFAAALMLIPTTVAAEDIQSLVVAGGCFWCVEADFEKVDGVTDVVSGYAGGSAETADYRTVTRGGTGHLEVVEITFDADVVTRAELLSKFMRSIDPLDDLGQFCDKGDSYRTAIFVSDEAEGVLATEALADASATLGQQVVTEIRTLDAFYEAEDYHQDFYKKNPVRYSFYRAGCGRDDRVRDLWGADAPFAKSS